MADKQTGYNKNSISNTLIVALGVCLVCATAVSATHVFLKSLQETNKLADKHKNILAAAGLLGESDDLVQLFDQRIIDRIIDLDTGEDVTDTYDNPSLFDQIDVAESNNQQESRALDDDPATIKRRENHSHVYIVKTSANDETPMMYVFPIRGKGLWSILKGFVALDADLTTIRGITYYDHAETPGLGGEVDNPEWKSHWTMDKKMFDESGKVAIRLVKADWQSDPHTIDALTGATITCRGVERMLGFWMGDKGFGPYLKRLGAGNQSVSVATTGGNNG